MEYYLVRLTYTPEAWQDMIGSTTSLDQRLEPVRKLIRHFGGALASYHFFSSPHFADAAQSHVVTDKFAMFGEHDLLTILAMPDRKSVQAFNMAVMAEPGLKTVDLAAMMPLEEAIGSMGLAKAAVAATNYAAPGRTP